MAGNGHQFQSNMTTAITTDDKTVTSDHIKY